jgi:ABC-2 type transport system permease protein
MIESIKEIWRYQEMLKSLVRQELRTRYKGSILGFLWTFVNPLLQLIVYTIVFSTIMRVNIDNFYIYLFVGLIPWLFFANTLQVGSTCIVNNVNLVKKIYFPRAVLPLSVVGSGFMNLIFSFVVVFLVLIVTGFGLSLSVLYLPFVLLAEFLICVGVALIVSGLNVYFRDLEHILGIITMGWFYFTPIVYPTEMIPTQFTFLFCLNPMYAIINSYKDILYYQTAPELTPLFITIMIACLLIIFGLYLFNHLEKNFAEEI